MRARRGQEAPELLVGGCWSESTDTGEGWPIRPGDVLLASARGALTLLLTHWQPRLLCVPDYVCQSIVQPALLLGIPVSTYPMSTLGEPDSGVLEDAIDEQSVVLAVEYFGWPLDSVLLAACRRRGARVVADCSQSADGERERLTDATIFSPRKLFPMMDGAVLRGGLTRAERKGVELHQPDPAWLEVGARAMQLRGQDPVGAQADWFRAYQRFERGVPTKPTAMSHTSRSVLTRLEYKRAARARQENFDTLASLLPSSASLLPTRPASVIPMGFPITVRDRDNVQAQLASQGIFAPVHWRDAAQSRYAGIASTRRMETELTLPVDQRYGQGDMRRVADAVNALIEAP